MRNGVTEAELIAAATGVRITLEEVHAAIVTENYFTIGAAATALGQPTAFGLGLTTVCALSLWNGFTILGKSACAHPDNFNEEIGKRLAKADAVNQIWPLMGYDLKSEIANEAAMVANLAPAKEGWTTYIGSKALHAHPATRFAYNELRQWETPADEDGNDEGYVVEYENGYISWSPKEVFERAYRPVRTAKPKAAAVRAEDAVEATQVPESWQDRVRRERSMLVEKFDALTKFTNSDVFNALPREDRMDLHNQYYHMEGYLRALERRLSRDEAAKHMVRQQQQFQTAKLYGSDVDA